MSKYRKAKHVFRFKINGDVEPTIIAIPTKVIPARTAVNLTLTADDVRRSMKLGGVGNTQTCSMAVCAKRQAGAFPHPVEGYIDWQYSTAYVVSKVSKKTGLPSECVCYEHKDDIAKVNDTRGGQMKLLKQLEKSGDRVIRLKPARDQHFFAPDKPPGNRDGSRSNKIVPRGAARRFAVAQAGIA